MTAMKDQVWYLKSATQQVCDTHLEFSNTYDMENITYYMWKKIRKKTSVIFWTVNDQVWCFKSQNSQQVHVAVNNP